MLVHEWQSCAACGGTGNGTDFCSHCGHPHPSFKPCLACRGQGGRLAIVERPDMTAAPSVLPAVESWMPLIPDWRPMYPAFLCGRDYGSGG